MLIILNTVVLYISKLISAMVAVKMFLWYNKLFNTIHNENKNTTKQFLLWNFLLIIKIYPFTYAQCTLNGAFMVRLQYNLTNTDPHLDINPRLESMIQKGGLLKSYCDANHIFTRQSQLSN